MAVTRKWWTSRSLEIETYTSVCVGHWWEKQLRILCRRGFYFLELWKIQGERLKFSVYRLELVPPDSHRYVTLLNI